MWKGSAVGIAKLALFAATAMLAFSGLFASAQSESLRVEAYRHYVEGYQRGRSDAMAKQDFDRHSPDTSSLENDLQQEYLRGYRDGYQLLMR